MLTKKLACIGLVISVGACVAPPASPMEKHARLASAAQLAGTSCAGYAGGYAGAKQLKQDANQNLATARNLGATDAVLIKAKTDVQNTFNTAAAFTSHQEACNQLIGSIAWSSS